MFVNDGTFTQGWTYNFKTKVLECLQKQVKLPRNEDNVLVAPRGLGRHTGSLPLRGRALPGAIAATTPSSMLRILLCGTQSNTACHPREHEVNQELCGCCTANWISRSNPSRRLCKSRPTQSQISS